MTTRNPRRTAGWDVPRLWALGGVTLLMSTGVWRLAQRGLDTLRGGLTPFQWVVLAAFTLMMIYFEGIRGIQQRFAPRVHRRAARVHARALKWRLLAPLYAMALVGGPRRMVWRARIGIAAIITAVLIVRAMPEPWRGIVDVGVALALGWGVAALLLLPLRQRAATSR